MKPPPMVSISVSSNRSVDIAHPEALVHEVANGSINGLVAHEYIVPVVAWTTTDPRTLRRRPPPASHPAPGVLHTGIWKDNVTAMSADWNPPCANALAVCHLRHRSAGLS